MDQKGKVNQLISICVQLGNEAAKIIHSIQTGGLKGEQWKGKDDPMTVADVKAQTLILKGIRQFYPSIKIVGEEAVEYEGDLGYDTNKLNPNLIPEQYFKKSNCNNEFDIDKVVVWVDPLDGTLSYVKEEYDAVTTLIGVSYEGRPLMGIITQPYYLNSQGDQKYVFKPKIYFCHTSIPQVYYAYGEELDEEGRTSYLPYEFKVKYSQRKQDNLIGTTQKHRVKQEILDFIKDTLKPGSLIQCGGAGKKALLVLEQDADYCVHFSTKASRWDTVVGEALLNCYNGQITDIYGQRYDYDGNLSCYYNTKGGIYTLKKDIHDYLIDKTKVLKLE